MNFLIYSAAFLLVCNFICTEAIFSGGTVAISGGGLLVAALGLKAIAGFGLLAASKKGGRRSRGRSYGKRRHGRSIDDLETILNETSFEDSNDCAKKLVCEVHAKAQAALDQTEAAIYSLFTTTDSIDVSKDTVQLDLAAVIGAKAGSAQCQKVYSRCEMGAEQLLAAIRQ